jgi:glycosyltransferase involved in cell wall biosynthesis
MLSFVIPVKNEQATVRELLDRIQAAVSALGLSGEVIFVDDGSDDESWGVIRSLVEAHEGQVRGIRFRRNLGKAAALSAGFSAARGEVVLTLDADLQDDPREIGRFLAKLEEGYDIVSGWKRVRHDPWHKVIPSRFFNAMLSALSRTRLHDHNCGFKCYRWRVVKELALYGEMHRMIPALGTIRGFRSTEIEVTHHPRRFGRSKYGLTRFFRGFMDMFTVAFLRNYRERPLHLMGGIALLLSAAGVLAVGASFVPGSGSRGTMALEIVGASMLASAVPVLALGLLAELLVEKLHGARPPIAIAEELPTTEISIGAELSLFDSVGSSRREPQKSTPPPSGQREPDPIRERVA